MRSVGSLLAALTGFSGHDSRSQYQESNRADDCTDPGEDEHRPPDFTSGEEQNDADYHQGGVGCVGHSQPKQQTAICFHLAMVRRDDDGLSII